MFSSHTNKPISRPKDYYKVPMVFEGLITCIDHIEPNIRWFCYKKVYIRIKKLLHKLVLLSSLTNLWPRQWGVVFPASPGGWNYNV